MTAQGDQAVGNGDGELPPRPPWLHLCTARATLRGTDRRPGGGQQQAAPWVNRPLSGLWSICKADLMRGLVALNL